MLMKKRRWGQQVHNPYCSGHSSTGRTNIQQEGLVFGEKRFAQGFAINSCTLKYQQLHKRPQYACIFALGCRLWSGVPGTPVPAFILVPSLPHKQAICRTMPFGVGHRSSWAPLTTEENSRTLSSCLKSSKRDSGVKNLWWFCCTLCEYWGWVDRNSWGSSMRSNRHNDPLKQWWSREICPENDHTQGTLHDNTDHKP